MQASQSWNIRFDEVIKVFGFIQASEWDSIAFLIVYVDDILLIRNDVELSGKHKGEFERSFSKKDFGEAACILGIKTLDKIF